ncbi:ORF6N domain-containing protein [Butyrivibrio proteoclasticus]|uniref:ORF6N domain-containing protein n=1 Tax=Butyrivibrio proteoclasticus TaxID=43305 RepID=UPI00047DB000|nr:ORF6N domain-containing protein [Butyrivibrio proteoclasticus]
MEEKNELVEFSTEIDNDDYEDIKDVIHLLRGAQIVLDSDLARLYGVETGSLNRAMKRNKKRFPEEFCFQITKQEYDHLKCQFGISSEYEHGGRRTLPFVYTEQGIAMLSSVLRGETAVTVSIRIMKTFVVMRKYLARNALLMDKVNTIEHRQIESQIQNEQFRLETEKKFDKVFDYIESHKEDMQKVFFDGQIFDAFLLLADIVEEAQSSITLIDGYVDLQTLNILAKKKSGVDVAIYTLPGTKLTKQDITNFNAQYPALNAFKTTAFHDRFMIIDGNKGYHIGASIKDAGKKCFGINRLADVGLINSIIQKAQSTGKQV